MEDVLQTTSSRSSTLACCWCASGGVKLQVPSPTCGPHQAHGMGAAGEGRGEEAKGGRCIGSRWMC